MRQNTNQQDRYEPVVKLSARVLLVCVALFAVGLIGTILGFVLGPNLQSWVALDVWFVTLWGLSQGMIIWAAAFRIAQARWAPTVIRIGQSPIFFLPFIYIVMLILIAGARGFIPWTINPIPEKAFYLNTPFFVWRNIIGVAILFILEFLMIRWSLNLDRKARNDEEITSENHYKLTAIAVATVILYTIVATIISYDFIMSLTPIWVSTMFGPYFWITNMYAGMAVMILVSGLLREYLSQRGYLTKYQFQDMGNLMLGFSLFSMGLFFAQYLTIWYENLPWETPFLIIRYVKGPWPVLAWTAFILEFAIPFIILQSRTVKRNPRYSMAIAIVALVGFILERYVLVVPSLLPQDMLLPILSLLGILAFGGALILAILFFLSRYSAVSAAQTGLPEVNLLEELE